MKKLTKFAFLIPTLISSFSCSNNYIVDDKTNELIEESVDINNIEEKEEININKSPLEKYIYKYYDFYLNYTKLETKYFNVDVSGTINGNSFKVLSCYLDSFNRVIMDFEVGDYTYSYYVGGLDFDVVAAYLESYVVRVGNPTYIINDDEIICSSVNPINNIEIANLSYYSSNYIKRLNVRVFYESSIVYYDLSFFNWR